jgi:hypothetical protein
MEGESTFQMYPLHVACFVQYSVDVGATSKEKLPKFGLVLTM